MEKFRKIISFYPFENGVDPIKFFTRTKCGNGTGDLHNFLN